MMQKNGLMGLVLVSGYRSYQYQKMLYTKKVKKMLLEGMRKEDACYQAAQIIAPPGCSEHQLGLAIDVTTQEMAQLEDPLTTDFEKTIQAKWLQNHAKEYGFILRYPQEKTAITHITYEPWHYRYVGINHAKKMGKLNLCLEEYEQVYLSLRTY
jgi:D-alanyl-D-alanine carboxypeptidase